MIHCMRKVALLASLALSLASACATSSVPAGSQPGVPASGVAPDADNKAVLDALDRLNQRPLHTLSPPEARTQPTFADGVKEALRAQGRTPPPPTATSRDIAIDGAEGKINAKLFTPNAGGAGTRPLIVYFHGGGFVIADSKVYESSAIALARETGALVLSVDYRRAPEAKFPAQHDDAFAAYRWALANAASLGADGSRVALAGESAGGNLAVATAIAARTSGLGAPKHILAVYPLAGGDLNTPSYQENANAKPLDRAAMAWFFHHSGRAPADALDPRISLVLANVSGLPPTTIILAQIDPLRSEGEMLAQKLQGAGVDTAVRTFDGVTHEFFGADAVIGDAKAAQVFAGERLKQSFGTP